VNALLTRFTVRANRAHKSINKHLGTYLPLVDSVTSVVLQKGAWVGSHVLKKKGAIILSLCVQTYYNTTWINGVGTEFTCR